MTASVAVRVFNVLTKIFNLQPVSSQHAFASEKLNFA
jgi:hypothetical protein